MKVLVITPYPVLPLTHGGRVRTYRLATGLARAGASVDVLCPWRLGLPAGRFRRDGVDFYPHRFVSNIFPPLLRDRHVPSLVALSWQPFGLGARRRLARSRGYDIVQFEFCAHSAWMERVRPSSRCVYSAHNVELDYLRESPWRSPLREAMLARLEELERRAVASADLVLTCTESDASRLAELYGRTPETVVIPNGAGDELLQLDRNALRARARAELGLADGERCLLFVGGPARHNREALAYLERRLVPELGDGVRLIVAGKCGEPSKGPLSTTKVLRLGYVDDLRPLLAAADVGVNPVTSGSGSSIKLVEYLAAGLPVVTTPIGMRGFDALGGLLLVAELDGFAAAVESAQPAEVSTRRTLESLAWSAIGQRLYEVYGRLAGSIG
jgi:glycosyltransferase involved in cell wall biosynthesis